jgi:RNA binding exosome subunit
VSFKSPIAYINIRAFSHATEDSEKVLAAIRNLIPLDLCEKVIFQKNQLTGHHRNPIILFEVKLTDKHVLPTVLQKIGAGLVALDKERLEREMKLHLEKGNLYLRFDKQFALQGKVRLSQNDPVHFKIHFKNKNFEEILEFCRGVGLLL